MYLRFSLSFRDVEELLAERGIVVTYESIRRCVLSFGPAINKGLARESVSFVKQTEFRMADLFRELECKHQYFEDRKMSKLIPQVKSIISDRTALALQ